MDTPPSVTAEGRYLDSDDWYTPDGNGQWECGRGNYSHCRDNPKGLYNAEEEDGDMTIIDILNTNQKLHQNEGSVTESSTSNDQSSYGEDETASKSDQRDLNRH